MDIMSEIKKAAKAEHTLMINYTDAKGDGSQREVEPYELKDGGLWAYDIDKGGIRQFKFDRISNAKMTNKPYSPRWAVII